MWAQVKLFWPLAFDKELVCHTGAKTEHAGLANASSLQDRLRTERTRARRSPMKRKKAVWY
jgi:hypothetical protein